MRPQHTRAVDNYDADSPTVRHRAKHLTPYADHHHATVPWERREGVFLAPLSMLIPISFLKLASTTAH